MPCMLNQPWLLSNHCNVSGCGHRSLTSVIAMREVVMTLLLWINLVLVAVILADYVVRQVIERIGEWRRLRGLLSGHPEMTGVHPEQDGLMVFEIEEDLASFILDNDAPGQDRPFRVVVPDFDDDV